MGELSLVGFHQIRLDDLKLLAALDLKIPAGSNQGSQLRLKGKGIPAKTPGDLYVVLDVKLPPADTDQAKALYEKMSEEMDFDPRSA